MTQNSDQLIAINQNWTNDDGTHGGGVSTGTGFTISWQRGPINVSGRNGAFLIEVLEACFSQLEYFQNSAYKSQENIDALNYLDKCIERLKSRRGRRETEGTLGTHQPDKAL
ncbi:MAG: hypothetical protein V7K14_03730 [Nostoc sp.]|uniref:hypothetical protein n=1 Tax=Nostoc sp. TaxID=1180 RepID=UPI002FF7A486